MKLKDWFKAKKEKRAAKKMQKVERKLGNVIPEAMPLDAEPAEAEVPKSRFTEEYREFLEKQEASRANAAENAERSIENRAECAECAEAAEELGEKIGSDYREDNGE